LAALILCFCATQTFAQAKPKPPPGRDPGGIAIALVGPGIDYRDQDLARRLARDGEGEPVAWDAVDGDARPFAHARANPEPEIDGTELAKLLLSAYANSRVIPVRAPSGDSTALMQAMRFAVRSPARIVALPLLGANESEWSLVREAATRHAESLFVLPAVNAAIGPLPENVVRVAPASMPENTTAEIWVRPRGSTMFGVLPETRPANVAEAVVLAASAAACAQHGRSAADGAEAKALLVAMASANPQETGRKTLDPMCLYGGQAR
jgi:hypothetical protein